MRLLFFVTYIEFYMKVIIISFLLTVTTFLLAIFMASIFNMFASVIKFFVFKVRKDGRKEDI